MRACPACDSASAQPAFGDGNRREGREGYWRFLRCATCQTLFLETLPDEAWLRAGYESGEIDPVAPPPPPVRRWSDPLRDVARRFRRRPHSWPLEDGHGRSILDFGCLTGIKLREFQERGWRIAGVDLNQEAIAIARREWPEGTWHDGPLAEFRPAEKFDVVRADNVVEHLPDPLAILTQLRALLKPGGTLLLYVPAAEAPSLRLARERSSNVWMPYHLTLFSRQGLKRLLERAGYASASLEAFTPRGWWSITARQLVARPGYARRPPELLERAAMWLGRRSEPFWDLVAYAGLGEEWIARARAPISRPT